MNEFQRIVDELRFLLQRDVVEQSDELKSLLARYSAACHDINVRLRRCDDCVKQGLRSEALHLADASPNLLETVAILDFPERQQLLDIVSMYFLDPPKPLLLDVASALNEAYAQHEPLQKLLNSHRLLALWRSPLAERLAVLRSLAKLDDSSSHWDADVREMELARLREIDTDSKAAAKAEDVATLKVLLGEVQNEGWREPVPAGMVRELKSRSIQANRSRALRRMIELNEKLREAFSALDVATARSLRDEWNQKQQICQLPELDPVQESVAPILEWLAEQDRTDSYEVGFSRAVAEIERALDKDHLTSAELKRLGLAVDRFDRALPPLLESRYRSRLATIELTESRRRRLLFGGGFFACVTAAVLFAVIVHFSYEAAQTRRVAAAVESYVDEGQLEEARKLIEQHPASTTGVWLAAQKKLADAEKAEKDRVSRWRSEIEIAGSSTEAIRIEEAIRQARELARTTDEKIEVGKLQSTWQKRISDDRRGHEQQFRVAISSASDALKELDTAIRESRDSGIDRLQKLAKVADSRVAILRQTQSDVSQELQSQATLLESRMRASTKAVESILKTSEFLDELTIAVLMPAESVKTLASADHYVKILRDFANAAPEDPRAKTFIAAAETSPLPAVIARENLINQWKRIIPIDEMDVASRIRAIQKYSSEYPQGPDRELIERYEKWLKAIQRRYSEDGDPDEGVMRRLAALFSSKFIADGNLLRDTKGRSYYLPGPRDTPFGSIATFKFLTGFNGETKAASMPPSDLVTWQTAAPPQAEIAKKVRASARNINTGKWSDYFADLTDSLLKAKQIDPFLRYLLVAKTLEFGGVGDLLLEQELTAVLNILNDEELDRTVAWMDPENKAAEKARERAEELLKKIPPLEPIFANAAKRQEELEAEIMATKFAVGWLENKPNGDWVCRTKWNPAGDHSLFAVSRANSTGVREWIELGQVQAKSMNVDPAASQAAGEGTVVFASSRKRDSKTVQLP